MSFDIFKYNNECYKQLEQKVDKKWDNLSSFHAPFLSYGP